MSARNVCLDPRAGDVVRVIPRLSDQAEPSPITIVRVTEREVIWERFGEEHAASLSWWKAETSMSGQKPTFELISEAHA
jgi:hypothetical protein